MDNKLIENLRRAIAESRASMEPALQKHHALVSALHAALNLPLPSSPEMSLNPFAGKMPYEVMLGTLDSAGGFMEEDVLIQLVISMGNQLGKSRPRRNLVTSINKLVKHGKLKRVGTKISLP